MRALIGCEESQTITKALRERGIEAYSNDILPPSGGFPDWHIEGDVFKAILTGGPWDLIILHPPCTHLAVSGNRWYGRGTSGHHKRLTALAWTKALWEHAKAYAPHVALENPVGVLKLEVEPQYIQPWEYGHGETKKTGFWRHNLPELQPTDIVDGREQRIWKMSPGPDRAKERSKTYQGIAEAIADQWGLMIKNR